MKARCLTSSCQRRIVGLSENERDWATHYYGHSPLERNVVGSPVTATLIGQRSVFPFTLVAFYYASLLALNSTRLIPTRCPHWPHKHAMHANNNSNSLRRAVAVSIPVTHQHLHSRHHCDSHSAGRCRHQNPLRVCRRPATTAPHLTPRPVVNWTKSRLSERSANS